MPFHTSTPTAPATTKAKRTTVKKARIKAQVVVGSIASSTPAPHVDSGLQYAGALIDPQWVKDYEKAHPVVRGGKVVAPKSITETIEGLLAPIADASFNPALIRNQASGDYKEPSSRDGFSVDVAEGFQLILDAAARLITDLHKGDTTMQEIGATRDGSSGSYFLEASALERCLSPDLKLAMEQFRIAARGVATALDGESRRDVLGDIKDAAVAEIMDEPEEYLDTETMLDIALSGYDNMEKERLAYDLLEEVNPGYKRPAPDYPYPQGTCPCPKLKP